MKGLKAQGAGLKVQRSGLWAKKYNGMAGNEYSRIKWLKENQG